jgi:hypothetical protein
MVGPVYGENAVYAHFWLSLGSHVPIDAIRTKDNVRVAVAPQNLLMHFPVTHFDRRFRRLLASTTISPVSLPDAAESRSVPSFSWNVPWTVGSTSPSVKLMVVCWGSSCNAVSLGGNSNAGNGKEQNRAKNRPHDNRPQKRPIVLVHQFADLTIAEVKAQNKNPVP